MPLVREAVNVTSSLQPAASRARHDLGQEIASVVAVLRRYLASMPLDVVVASLIICLTSLFLPFAINRVYDRIVPMQAIGTLGALTVLLLGCMLVEVALRIARSYLLSRIAVQASWLKMRASMDALSAAPAETLAGPGKLQWLQRLQSLSQASDFGASPVRLFVVDLLFVPIFLVLLVLTGGIVAIVPVAVALGALGAIVHTGRRMRDLMTERHATDAQLQRFVTESIASIGAVRTLGLRQYFEHRFAVMQNGASRSQQEIAIAAEHTQGLSQLITSVAQIVTLFVTALMAIEGTLSPGLMICSSILATRTVAPVARLALAWQDVQSELALATDATGEGLQTVATKRLRALPVTEGSGPPDVSLVDVSTCVLLGDAVVLDNVTLEIKPGEMIAVMGQDATANELLLRIIAGDAEPILGSVLVGGIAATQVDRRAIGAVAYLPPMPQLVRGSIMANITLHRPWVTPERARGAARLVGLEQEIVSLQHGFETKISDAPQPELSGSVCKRIGLARTLAATPKLVVMGEPQFGLDLFGQMQLERMFAQIRGKATIVVSTSSPRVLAQADRAFELRQGRLSEVKLRKPEPVGTDTKVGSAA